MAKVIMGDVTVYIIRSGRTYGIKDGCVYLNKEFAKQVMDEQYIWQGYNAYLDSVILPFVGKYVLYIDTYLGFDYNYGGGNIYDINCSSCLYPSIELAKQDNYWKGVMYKAKQNPDDYNVYDDKICSREESGEDWDYGNVMENKVSVKIRKLRVIR